MNQGLVVGLNGGTLSGNIQAPLFTSFNNSEEFAIMYQIIMLCGIQHHREISHRLICFSIPPIAKSLTSVSTTNGRLKSGKCRTGAWASAYLSASKAY